MGHNKIFFFINCINFPVIVLYIKYVLLDNAWPEIYIKWIPATLLLLQTGYFLAINRLFINQNKNSYHKYLMFGYIACIVGDILLIDHEKITYMFGMLAFFFSYLFFGLGRITNVPYHMRYIKREIMVGVILLLIVELCYMTFIISSALNNNDYNDFYTIFAICVYSFVIMFCIFSNYVYLVMQQDLSACFSLIGVILFAVSDCIIIMHDIRFQIIYLEIIGMILYWLGLIVLGCSVYYNKHTYVMIDII